MDSIIEDRNLSISRGGILPLGPYRDMWIFKKIESILKSEGFDISTPIKDIPDELLEKIIYGKRISVAVESTKYPGTLWHTNYDGVVGFINKTRKFRSGKSKDFMDDFVTKENCQICDGKRLKKESLHFKISNTSISELNSMSIKDFSYWINSIETHLDKKQKIIAKPIIKEIRQRVDLMVNLGLDYLSLDRPLRTLSGGEAQRIRLASQIGSGLVGVMYVLDEPSIGLHQRDNERLLQSLERLRDLGNTIIMVEHDTDAMLRADYVVDLGPGAGVHGGRVIAAGTPDDIKNAKRFCNKDQKVIKVPNSGVFKIVAPLLVSKGISRIVTTNKLIAL